MLLKLGLDANILAILASIGIGVYKYIFIWRVNITRIPHS